MVEATDREILIRMDQRTIGMAEDIKEMRVDFKDLDHRIREVEAKTLPVADHEGRIRVLEDKTLTASGFIRGAAWVKTLVFALPVGVIGWFLNQSR